MILPYNKNTPPVSFTPAEFKLEAKHPEVLALDDKISHIWEQYDVSVKNGNFDSKIYDELFNSIDLLSKKTQELKNELGPLSQEITYLTDRIFASRMQIQTEHERTDIISTKTETAPKEIQINYDDPEQALKQIGEVKNPFTRATFFQKLLSLFFKKVADVKGDGNCALRAFAKGIDPLISPDEEDLMQNAYRVDMVDYMIENRDFFEGFLSPEDVPVEEIKDVVDIKEGIEIVNFDKYMNRMKKDGKWLGQHELQALAQSAGRPIWVYKENCLTYDKETKTLIPLPEYRCYGAEFKKNPICLYHSEAEHHYRVLLTPLVQK